MCEICNHTPCLSRCPNAPEPRVVYSCKWCKEGIIDGEDYVDIDGGHLHLYDCFWDWLNDHDLTDIVEKLGGTIGTAELPAPDWED